MAESIYKRFIANMSEAWHALGETEQTALLEKVNAALEEVGGRRIVMCDSSWPDERRAFFGVEAFPDIDAAQRPRRFSPASTGAATSTRTRCLASRRRARDSARTARLRRS